MTPKQLQAENEELKYQRDRLRAMFTTDLMPCGHPSAFTVEETPDDFVCLYCQLAALAWARWVSVDERLPEESGHILIWIPGVLEPFHITWYRTDEKTPWKFTHWMHLPPPPEQQ